MAVKDKPKDRRLQLVAGFVLPEVKSLVQKIADSEGRSESQVVRKLLEESPRVKAQLRRNGKARAIV
jgi:hypothetical protein